MTPAFPKRNKYKASKQQYNGSIYHSRMEARYAALLDSLKSAKDPSERVVRWDRQVSVRLYVNEQLICKWYVDFVVWYADGREVWTEVKGCETEAYRIKRKLFEALYPNRELLIVRKVG